MANFEYDTTFKCTYNLIDETDEDESYDIEYSDDLYRSQFLQAFCLNDWDGAKINRAMEYIFKITCQTTEGKEIIKLAQQKYNIYKIDDDGVMPFLFSYDNFYLFHDCLIDIISKTPLHLYKFKAIIDKLNFI